MRVTRRVAAGVVLVLAALWVSISWLADAMSPSSSLAQLTIQCNGGPDERRFLADDSRAELKQGFRHLTSGDGFILYRIPLGASRAERLSYCISRVAYHLEYSADGTNWHDLARLSCPDADGSKFSVHSSGFPAGVKASQQGVAYVRLSANAGQQSAYPAIRWLTLAVSGPVPPGFSETSWTTRAMTLLALLGPKLMIFIGFGAVFFSRKRWKTPWSLFLAGALLWMVSVAAKAGLALLLNVRVHQLLLAALPVFPANVLFSCYLGSLTGLFECGIFLLVASRIRQRTWDWKAAASLGVGFGGMEAIALGIGAAVLAALHREPGAIVDAVSSLLGPTERMIALVIHVASVVMIIYAITRRRWIWFAASCVFKSGVDATAAFALLNGVAKTAPWFAELCYFTPFAFVGAVALAILAYSWQDAVANPQTA